MTEDQSSLNVLVAKPIDSIAGIHLSATVSPDLGCAVCARLRAPPIPCHCEARSDAAIPTTTHRRQEIAERRQLDRVAASDPPRRLAFIAM
jgi:hypothetical protein